MKNLVVIQLNRLGDLLQTAIATGPLKKINSNIKVTLIAREKFAKNLSPYLNQVFDDIILINDQEVDLINSKKDVNLSHLVTDKVDVLVNLSFCKPSAKLASYIPTVQKLGLHQNPNGELVVNDIWSQYVYSTVLSKKHNPYHLVDLFKNILGTKNNNFEFDLADQLPETRKKQIVLHPFASNKRKAWTHNKWSTVIKSLSNHVDNIYIVGSEDESSDADFYKTNTPKVINLCGQDLDKVFNEIKNSQLFLGTDSFISHLAAIAKTPTLTVTLGPVKPQESMPYSSNAFTIAPKTKCHPCNLSEQCDYFACHHDVSPELTAEIALSLIEKSSLSYDFFERYENKIAISTVSIYKATIENNEFNFENINFENLNYNNYCLLINKIIFDLYLKDNDYIPNVPKLSPSTVNKVKEDLKSAENIFELFQHGKNFSARIANSESINSDKQQEIINNISEIQNYLQNLKKDNNLFINLIDFVHTRLNNAPGNTLEEIAAFYTLVFEDAATLTASIVELTHKTIAPFIKHMGSENFKEV